MGSICLENAEQAWNVRLSTSQSYKSKALLNWPLVKKEARRRVSSFQAGELTHGDQGLTPDTFKCNVHRHWMCRQSVKLPFIDSQSASQLQSEARRIAVVVKAQNMPAVMNNTGCVAGVDLRKGCRMIPSVREHEDPGKWEPIWWLLGGKK